jgi:hypothetical protein
MNQFHQHGLVVDLIDRGFSVFGLALLPPGPVK